jgi:hypothetical protein
VSALTQEWAPGVNSPGARPFVNEVDDLALSGVQFAPEQIDLLDRASVHRPGPWWNRLHALTLVLMHDPTNQHAAKFGLPAMTIDDEDRLNPVLVPAVTEIDCTDWETFDETEPNWRRYPSVLGRTHVYSSFSGTLLEGLAPIRLWNLWPIEQEDVQRVKEASQNWLRNEWTPYLQWLEVSAGTSPACDYEGTPEHLHDHEYDEHGYVRACINGERWYEHFSQTQMVYTDDGDYYPKPFGPVTGLRELEPVWENLLYSSRSNTTAAISSYPVWEQEEVVRTERHYSPWLWSS